MFHILAEPGRFVSIPLTVAAAAVAVLAGPTDPSHLPGGQDGGPAAPTVMTGRAAFTDYRGERPGVRRKITPADLPEPYATTSVENGAELVSRPPSARPQAPPGFTVAEYAGGLNNPRLIRTAPNGDLFVAESAAGRVRILRGLNQSGGPQTTAVFAANLHQPFGIAFYPPGARPEYVYVANTDSVVRFPYQNGDLAARGPAETLTELPGGGRLRGGGHWTRDIAFSADGRRMFVSVGSRSNDDDTDNNPAEDHRADILEFDPQGRNLRVFASGIRNAVGIAINPSTGELWASVNERDGLGDNLPPDYVTAVREGGFYGWPWFYTGGHQDPRHKGKHPELAKRVITPDVLVQPHSASLGLAFYEGGQFPPDYRGDVFASEHGSWNRSAKAGYEVIRVPVRNGRATGEYEDFITGFVTASGAVWGRPVGVAVARDGALMVSDDGSNTIWRVTYGGPR